MRILNTRYDEAAPVASLQLHPENPRQGDVGGIFTSIEANGFYGALVVQESTGRILAGNHRYRAAAEDGAETIPVIYVDCDDATARKIMLADNRLADLATNDTALLTELLQNVAAEGTLEGTGYDGDDLDDLLKGIGLQGAGGVEGATGPGASSPSPGDPGENRYKAQFGVIVVCATESDQETVYNRLKAEGFTCRIVTT
jgi:hypothetical protein